MPERWACSISAVASARVVRALIVLFCVAWWIGTCAITAFTAFTAAIAKRVTGMWQRKKRKAERALCDGFRGGREGAV